MNKQVLIIAATAATSLAAGGVGGYFLGRKLLIESLDRDYNTRMEEEIEQTRRHYMKMVKTDVDPEDFIKEKYGAQFTDETTTLVA